MKRFPFISIIVAGLVVTAPAQVAGQPAPAAPPAADQVAAFPNAPAVTGLVFIKREDLQPQGLTNVTGVVVKDVKVLQTPKFEKLASSYLGKPMNEETMKALQREIILFCRGQDRPLVDVIYPEQDVTAGVLQVIVLEGKLKSVLVEDAAGAPYTNRWLSAERLRGGVRAKENEPISERQLVGDLDWLNRNPFRTVRALYQPTIEYGMSELVLRADARRPFEVFGGIDNTGTDATGKNRLQAGFNWGNALGFKDHQFNLQYTDDVEFKLTRAVSGSYSVPLPWRNSVRVFGAFVDSTAEVDANTLLKGKSYVSGLRYEIPLPFIHKYQHETSVGLDYKFTDNNLEFGGSSVNTPYSVFQVTLGYSGVLPDAWGQTGITLQGYYSPGGVGPRNTDDDFNAARPFAESEYVYGRFSAERITRLPFDFSWILRGSVQVATGNLVPSEQFGLGGYATVRGYDEREANGDEGWYVVNELRTPPISIFHLLGSKKSVDRFQVLGFFDTGSVSNIDLIPLEPSHVDLQSVGVGFQYTIGRNLAARFDYGWPLKDIIEQDRNPARAHFSVILSY